jgi:uncharacterized protein YdcH (DUF465 family)
VAAKRHSRSLGDLLIDKGVPVLLAGIVAVIGTYYTVRDLDRDVAELKKDHDVVTKLVSEHDALDKKVDQNEANRTKQLEGIGNDLKTIMMALPRR